MSFKREQILNTTPAAAFSYVSARRKNLGTRFVLLILALALGACDEGGGSDGAPAANSAATLQIIELPPGLTQATLGWMPSEGSVERYLVYESRNGGDYEFVEDVMAPRHTVMGTAGEAVRVSVLALNTDGKPSGTSVPSPELHFNAATEAVAAATLAETTVASFAASTSSPDNSVAANTAPADTGSNEETNVASAADAESEATSDDSAEDAPSTPLLDAAMRSLLIESGARFPIAGLTDAAQSWLQTRVEEQFQAGTRLVGTGQLDQDGLSEFVWQDPSGQLFFSTGRALLDLDTAADTPLTFQEGVRLRATERFVALADFSGDGAGDWVVEDVSTGDVWMIDHESQDVASARSDSVSADSELVTNGDFDGDGRQEFLWLQANGELRFGHPGGTPARLDGLVPIAATSVLVAVADIDGDGGDDLVAIDENGHIEWTLVQTDEDSEAPASFEVRMGPDLSTNGLELLGSFDVDDDGRAEIGWLNGDEVEIWEPTTGPESD